MDKAYFFDTYAIIELLKGNPNYLPYQQAHPIISIFNLVELHYAVLRERGNSLAEQIIGKYKRYVIPTTVVIIQTANEFRYHHRKQKMSTADVIGYITAQKNALKFLTGDNAFRGMDNVEFVK